MNWQLCSGREALWVAPLAQPLFALYENNTTLDEGKVEEPHYIVFFLKSEKSLVYIFKVYTFSMKSMPRTEGGVDGEIQGFAVNP